jgi:hypothetical protein
MTDTPEGKMPEMKMDPAALYHEEIFTDRKMGTIRRLTPVKPDGSPDPARKVVYIGESQLLTSVGALPLNFEIAASSLDEAAREYGAAVKRAFEDAMEELAEMRRRASSSLILPKAGAGPLGPGSLDPGRLGPGGLPGGGKIKFP